jgi:hypothetical protein
MPLPEIATTDQQLRFAIAHKRLIRCTYNSSERLAEPHDYGVQRGVTRLLVYQRRAWKNGLPRHPAIGWRLLDVAKISACAVLDEPFQGSRVAEGQHHGAWDILYARVE